MTPGAIIRLRHLGRRSPVTLMREWWVLYLSYIYLLYDGLPFSLLHTRQVVTWGKPLLISMRMTAMGFASELNFPDSHNNYSYIDATHATRRNLSRSPAPSLRKRPWSYLLHHPWRDECHIPRRIWKRGRKVNLVVLV